MEKIQKISYLNYVRKRIETFTLDFHQIETVKETKLNYNVFAFNSYICHPPSIFREQLHFGTISNEMVSKILIRNTQAARYYWDLNGVSVQLDGTSIISCAALEYPLA